MPRISFAPPSDITLLFQYILRDRIEVPQLFCKRSALPFKEF